METVLKISLIVPCAGSGKRMNSAQNKMLLPLMGQTILERTLQAFLGVEEIFEVLLIHREEDREIIETLTKKRVYPYAIKLVLGGKERQDSVQQGLSSVGDAATHVMIHDGARPFVTPETLRLNLKALREGKSACTGVPSKDTLKIVDVHHRVSETPDRSKYWNVQTPQSFERDLLERAYVHATASHFKGTDDASLVEFLGEPVHMVMGSYDNIKVTTMEDLAFGKAILEFRAMNEHEKDV